MNQEYYYYYHYYYYIFIILCLTGRYGSIDHQTSVNDVLENKN